MVWFTLFKYTALGVGALVLLTLVLSLVVGILGTILGLGLALLALVFAVVVFGGTLVALAAIVYGAYVLLSRTSGKTSDATTEPTGETAHDPVERIKRQYASGEISEAELERRLEFELDGSTRDPIERELLRESERH